MRAVLETQRIDTAEELARLEPAWWDLWRRAPAATPFQSPAWLLPWWRAFHPGQLSTIAVHHGGGLVGLAPFYIEDGALGRRVLPVGISLSDYLDVLIDPVVAEKAGAAIVAAFERDADRWDEWDLEELAPGAAALALPCPARCGEHTVAQSACPVLDLEPSPDWGKILPIGKRRQIRLARNRAARRGTVAVERAERANALEWFDDLSRLHAERWRDRGEAGVLAHDPVQQFQRAAVPGLIDAGLLLLYRLTIDGATAAVCYGFVHRDRTYLYIAGFDPAFSFESPGVILYAHAIDQAVAEGARELHFLRGQEPYKYGWGVVDRWNVRRSFRRLEAGQTDD